VVNRTVLPATGLRFTCRQVYRLRSIQQGSSESWLVSAHDASLLVNLVSAQVLSKGRDTYDTYPCESFRSTRGPLSPLAWDFSLKRKFLKRSFSPFSSRLLHYHHFRAHRFQFGCDSPLLRLHLPFLQCAITLKWNIRAGTKDSPSKPGVSSTSKRKKDVYRM
jgi:hypothetical protein